MESHSTGREGFKRRKVTHIKGKIAPFLREISVVQRQLWLRHNVPGITPAQAYDQARKEFYEQRLQEDVERRVAKEEATSTGAYFGPSVLDIGMALEDKEYEKWKVWAQNEVDALAQKNAAMYSDGIANEATAIDADDGEYNAAIEEVSDQIPAQGQSALGGALVHP